MTHRHADSKAMLKSALQHLRTVALSLPAVAVKHNHERFVFPEGFRDIHIILALQASIFHSMAARLVPKSRARLFGSQDRIQFFVRREDTVRDYGGRSRLAGSKRRACKQFKGKEC